ncbi:MAG: hypothetical protein ACI83N_000201 [Hydrogenophaga sp.]|jgi:hypothetical protein
MKKVLGMLALLAAPLMSQAIEEPAYTVERAGPVMEIRAYAPYVVAEVVVQGTADEASSQGFSLLAGYIFGKNRGERKMAMTAPVTQTAEPVKMDMTAPVTQSAAEGGGYRVQFVLPQSVTLATAPEPIDPRVQLREVPASRVAVIRYSGFWTQANQDEHLARLEAALRAGGQAWTGEPMLSRYNPPWTPWFMRRNEIWLRLP